MEVERTRFDEVVRQGLAFVLRLALVLGGLGFASVFAVALLVGGIYLIATGHPSGGYALRRMARHLNHRSQRRYRLKFADTNYGEINHYGMYWLKWADVRR